MKVQCKICDATAKYLCDTKPDTGTHPFIRERFSDEKLPSVLHHFRCPKCDLVFVGNSISTAEISVAYGLLDLNAYYHEVATEDASKQTTAVDNLRGLGLAKNAAILDIGAGNGDFVRDLRAAGFECLSGHEIPGGDLSALNSLGVTLYRDFDYQSIPDASQDCITLLDVAEHVIDPHYLIEQCNRILKVGGWLYFHTPMVTRLDRFMHLLQSLPFTKRVGVMWQRGRTSIYHLQNYSARSVKCLLKRHGFDHYWLEQKNELSWPVEQYIDIYFSRQLRLPKWLGRCLSPFFALFLATNTLNPNKGIVAAQKSRSVNTSAEVTPLSSIYQQVAV